MKTLLDTDIMRPVCIETHLRLCGALQVGQLPEGQAQSVKALLERCHAADLVASIRYDVRLITTQEQIRFPNR
jgi:hypothetical protein